VRISISISMYQYQCQVRSYGVMIGWAMEAFDAPQAQGVC